MKLLIRFCTVWGNYITSHIEIKDLSSYNDIKNNIETKFGIQPQYQLLKYKRDGYTLRIVENYPFSFYEIKESSMLYVEKIESKEAISQALNSKNVTKKYYSRLGFVDSIKEEECEDQNPSGSSSSFKIENEKLLLQSLKDINSMSPTKRSIGFLSGNNSPKRLSFESKKYFEMEIESLLKETKHGNLKEITHILESYPENLSPVTLLETRERKQLLFNEKGNLKWNAVHFAVFSGNLEILKYFCENGEAELNKETDEGWTPLQLAIQKNNTTILKFLLSQENIDINKLTHKGTALHVACSMNKPIYVSMLLAHNADPSIMNNEGYIPADLSPNEELINIINKESKLKEEFSFKEVDFDVHPLYTGIIYKVGDSFITLYERYFVLNTDNGTLIRYRSQKDCPNKPSEIVPLRDISYIKKISDSWYMRTNFNYFEIAYNDSRQILACRFKSTVNIWVKHIYEAFRSSQQIEERLQKLNEHNDLMKLATFSSKLASNEPLYVEIQDIKREESIEPNESSVENSKPFSFIQSSELKPENEDFRSKNHFNDLQARKQGPLKASYNDNGTGEEALLEEEEKVNFKSFQILKIIGSGAFGKIFLVKKKDNGQIYAMKALKKKELIQKRQLIYAVTECNVLKKARHPFIVQLYYSFQTPNYLYFVMDYCPGGDLSLHLAKNGSFPEDISRFYIAELILAIEYMHNLNILYRDMKPENILLDTEGHIKLADFGLAKENMGAKDNARSFCGSPAYLPPEIISNKGSTRASDIYGIGAVLYEMLTGNPPYYDYDLMKMYRSIEEGKLVFPDNISWKAKKLLKKMLHREPNQRIGINNKNELKNDEFFEGLDWVKLAEKKYTTPLLDEEDFDDELSPFERHINHKDLDYDINNKKVNRVIKFTFSRKEEEDLC